MVTVTLGLNKTQLALLSIYLVVAVDMFGLTLVIPVSITYSEYLGADKSMIGFLYTAYSVGALLSSLVIGRISDIFGRRKVFLYTLSGAMICKCFSLKFVLLLSNSLKSFHRKWICANISSICIMSNISWNIYWNYWKCLCLYL